MIVAVAGLAVNRSVVADAESGDDSEEDGHDEDEECEVLNRESGTFW